MVAQAYPAIFFDNRFADAVPVASTTALGAAVNLADFRPYRQWKPASLPATVTADCAPAATPALRGQLLAGDAAVNDSFGSGVALSANGLIMAVGARTWEGSATNQGGVYIYDWSGGAWVQRGSVLVASDAEGSGSFGYSVALSANGAILVVGAPLRDGAGTDRGGVYIYDWSGSAWVMRGSVLTASDTADSDDFGRSVAISSDGSVLAVGAYNWEGSETNQGGVYIYDWSGGAWVQRGSVLVASDAAASDQFGFGVSLSASGAVLAVGAGNWEGATTNQGGVYIYDWSGSAWVQRGSVLVAPDAAASDNFGSSVALNSDGSTLAVGARQLDWLVSGQGGVYLFDKSGSSWVQRGAILADSSATTDDAMGSAVALSGDGFVVAVGAELHDGPLTGQGTVYVYDCTRHADSLSVFGHSLFSCRATIEVRGSTDNFSSSDVLLASKAPSDDKPFVLFFASASYRYWRVRITGSTAPTLSLCMLGNALQFPCGVAYGFAQLGREAVKQSNISETGQPLGSATLFDKWARTLNFPAIANTWLRNTFLPAWQAQLRDGPFLFAHNLSGYQNDIYLVTSGGKFDDVPASIGKSSLVFDVEGAAL